MNQNTQNSSGSQSAPNLFDRKSNDNQSQQVKTTNEAGKNVTSGDKPDNANNSSKNLFGQGSNPSTNLFSGNQTNKPSPLEQNKQDNPSNDPVKSQDTKISSSDNNTNNPFNKGNTTTGDNNLFANNLGKANSNANTGIILNKNAGDGKSGISPNFSNNNTTGIAPEFEERLKILTVNEMFKEWRDNFRQVNE